MSIPKGVTVTADLCTLLIIFVSKKLREFRTDGRRQLDAGIHYPFREKLDLPRFLATEDLHNLSVDKWDEIHQKYF